MPMGTINELRAENEALKLELAKLKEAIAQERNAKVPPKPSKSDK